VRVCGNCGNTQGPFDKTFVGFRKTGRWVFTCKVPVKDANGKPIPGDKRAEMAMECTKRAEKRRAST
jgi:hypothetical protein